MGKEEQVILANKVRRDSRGDIVVLTIDNPPLSTLTAEIRRTLLAELDTANAADPTLEEGRPAALLYGERDRIVLTRSAEGGLIGSALNQLSGAGGLLASTLPIGSELDRTALDTGLVYAHVEGAGAFADVSPGPYPDEKAAVHHLLREGWMYVLPFDHAVASVGILLRLHLMLEAWAVVTLPPWLIDLSVSL